MGSAGTASSRCGLVSQHGCRAGRSQHHAGCLVLPAGQAAFALNVFLNTLWSLFFFRLQRPDWALDEVGFLWLSIALLIFLLARASHLAALLLLPYIAWVSFAAVLNWKIVQLNAPFPSGG
jgi:tryptophan-rich sensory protein